MTEITRNYCPRHPRTETNLRCGKCEELVCADCLVHTPVGVRCPNCARQTRVPTYDVTRSYMARAIVAGFGIAIAGGFALVFLARNVTLPYLDSILFIALGYAVGEGISRATNRKRGRSLQFIAGLSMLAAYLIISLFSFRVASLFALVIAFYIATWRLGR
ncbi:MAG: B-box zinc finger protein [Chloroflexi bacterium]|nr:B-box zinc finger protein [Chloroflexota bacterium]